MTRVQFPFGDATLVGTVVDRDAAPVWPATDRTRLTVAVDGREYAVLASDATPLEDA